MLAGDSSTPVGFIVTVRDTTLKVSFNKMLFEVGYLFDAVTGGLRTLRGGGAESKRSFLFSRSFTLLTWGWCNVSPRADCIGDLMAALQHLSGRL